MIIITQEQFDLTGTMSGIVYTLTVNGISNSDGIIMDPAGLSKAFYGYYIAPVDPPSPPNPPPAEQEQCTVQASQQNGQDLALSETNLNGAVIRLTLTNDKFHSWLETQSFELINAPTGTSISGISWIDDTHADVITIKPQGLYNSEGATTTSILITAVVEDNNGSNVAA